MPSVSNTPASAYSGQLLTILQVAIDTRSVDKELLLRISLARIACTYSIHLFHARARLDLPTFEDTAVQRQLEDASTSSGHGLAWDTLQMGIHIMSAAVQVVSQVGVLGSVLSGQRDGFLLAIISFSASAFDWFNTYGAFSGAGVWAATTKNKDFIQMQGLKRVVNDMEHRKEFIAGNLAEFSTSEFRETVRRVGDDAGDFWELRRAQESRTGLRFWSLWQDPLRELPQIVFTLRAVQYPSSMPVSLASLNLIQQTTMHFTFAVYRLFSQTVSIADQLATVRKLYEVAKIPNRIVDGAMPFPEDAQKLICGVALEFRNVSFKYPGATNFAIRNVSFKLAPGQLCVIVGANGSGKSTILKLIVRLYDPEEGQIFVNGLDIRTLKLFDLRQAISVLFQDYTHFPLSIRDNIALGDPSNFRDDERVHKAAKLGGAEEFIERLSEGFDTYLERPVRDYYAGLPEARIRCLDEMSTILRLAVSRTFMRSVVSEDAKVGLLLFDEPSASLDPTAEHDLFARLRELRGSKTMLFSSHASGASRDMPILFCI
ncbi:hypothetical protein A0H81_00110 [Grifola frondosa]|uniref:ABC transporter domain-containing protein n=1 Tax=Grifola frondosa TaxID=5627 RepID=A0A1C7MQR1_GRIFR|nr:hypothetical protein A0H81_00110 [Grifola frondosa]